MKTGKQLYALFIAFTLTLLFISQAYSLWYSKLRANFSVSIGELDVKIGSYKIVSCCHCHHNCSEDYSISANLSSSGYKLTVVFKNIYPKWGSYVGIVIANEGTLPAKFKSVNVKPIASLDVLKYFNYEIKYFGPFSGGDFTKTVWSNIKCCNDIASLTGISLPTVFYSSQKIVAWIGLNVNSSYSGESGVLKLEITLRYTGGW